MSDAASPRTWLIAGGAVVIIGALIAIALAREPVALDPGTPEGTVQNYLQAISDEDYIGAFNLLHPDWTKGCTAADLAAAAPTDPFSATLGNTEETGTTAFVRVTIRQGAPGPGPFESGFGSFEEFFELENEIGQWLITGYPWPYFDWRCQPR